MLYVLIMYCTGFCGPLIPPPSDVLLFTSYADCQQKMDSISLGPTMNGKKTSKMQIKQTCARVFSDPEQLDRILNPEKLGKALAEQKAHPDGWKPWTPSAADMKAYGCKGDTSGLLICKRPMDEPVVYVNGLPCLKRKGDPPPKK